MLHYSIAYFILQQQQQPNQRKKHQNIQMLDYIAHSYWKTKKYILNNTVYPPKTPLQGLRIEFPFKKYMY